MAEEMAYSAQNFLSFEKGAENIKRYLNVEVGKSMVRSVSERIEDVKKLDGKKGTHNDF